MNKKIVISLIFAVLFFVAISYRTQIVSAIGAVLRSGADVPDGALAMRTSSSTTTPNFLENGTGTTTLTFASDNFKSLTLYLQVMASSTNTRTPLKINVQASDDNIQFFDYDPTILEPTYFQNTNATTSIALASTTIAYSYQPYNRQSTTTKVVDMRLLPAKYTRLVFTVSSTTPNTATPVFREGMNLWANVVGQIEGGR